MFRMNKKELADFNEMNGWIFKCEEAWVLLAGRCSAGAVRSAQIGFCRKENAVVVYTPEGREYYDLGEWSPKKWRSAIADTYECPLMPRVNSREQYEVLFKRQKPHWVVRK